MYQSKGRIIILKDAICDENLARNQVDQSAVVVHKFAGIITASRQCTVRSSIVGKSAIHSVNMVEVVVDVGPGRECAAGDINVAIKIGGNRRVDELRVCEDYCVELIEFQGHLCILSG